MTDTEKIQIQREAIEEALKLIELYDLEIRNAEFCPQGFCSGRFFMEGKANIAMKLLCIENEKDKSNERSPMNKWEKACREWLKGCSCAQDGKQEECQECIQAFLEKIREIKTEE